MKDNIFLIVLMFFCSGCVPFPHFETQVPQVSGIVTKDGVPLSEAKVRISHREIDWSCSKAETVSTTDADGHFDLKRERKFRFIRPLIADPFFNYHLCIITGDNIYLGYMSGGVGYPPDSVTLNCKINSDSKSIDNKTPMAIIHKFAVCTPDKDIKDNR